MWVRFLFLQEKSVCFHFIRQNIILELYVDTNMADEIKFIKGKEKGEKDDVFGLFSDRMHV